jgi:hypothetical protein
MLLLIKNGAITEGVAREIWFAIGVMAQINKGMSGEPLVVTSLRDGAHMEGSKHATGYAVDVRTRDWDLEHRQDFHDCCKQWLDPHGFDLVIEGPPFNDKAPHEHCEYDPKTGESFLILTD